jgi:hypothetical protein
MIYCQHLSTNLQLDTQCSNMEAQIDKNNLLRCEARQFDAENNQGLWAKNNLISCNFNFFFRILKKFLIELANYLIQTRETNCWRASKEFCINFVTA